MSKWTLGRFYQEVGLNEIPVNQIDVPMVHPKTGELIEPRQYQIEGVTSAMSSPNGRYGLFDDMGTGKSLISYVYGAWHAGMGNRVLCVMPPKLLRQYKQNFYKMFPGIPLRMEIYHGTPKKRDALAEEWDANPPDIILTSFEFFRRNPIHFSALLGCDVLIADEARWISNPDNSISRSCRMFMEEEGKRAALIMNGTPARNDLLNLYGYIDFLTPGAYKDAEHFKRSHILYEKFLIDVRVRGRIKKRPVYKISGYKNQEFLYNKLYQQGRRIKLQLAASCDVIEKEFDLSDKHYHLYRKLVEERLLMFDDDTVLDITEAAKVKTTCMRAIIDPTILGLEEESEVINTTLEMLEEIDFSETKVLLAAYYQKTVEKLMEVTRQYNPVCLYGKVTGAKAEANKQRFLNDPDCKVMIINYESGGVGLDGLQNVCKIGIAVEPTAVPGDFWQSVGRLHRSGQENDVVFWVLCPFGTLYSRIIKERLKKEEAIDSVVGRGTVSVAELRSELLDGNL